MHHPPHTSAAGRKAMAHFRPSSLTFEKLRPNDSLVLHVIVSVRADADVELREGIRTVLGWASLTGGVLVALNPVTQPKIVLARFVLERTKQVSDLQHNLSR
jgi:hypothetical protein